MSGFIIDINEIKRTNTVEKEGVVHLEDCEAAVKLSGVVETGDGGAYLFKGRLTGFLNTSCSRCLAPVSLPYDAEIEFFFSDANNAPDEETLVFTGNKADFLPVVAGTVLADKPISVLCREDCSGLCEVCGNDLNISDCGCLKDLINPVIDKSLFDNLK